LGTALTLNVVDFHSAHPSHTFGNKQATPVEATFAGFRYLASISFWQVQAIKLAVSGDQILTRINGSHGNAALPGSASFG
jgi:hypothetical protein